MKNSKWKIAKKKVSVESEIKFILDVENASKLEDRPAFSRVEDVWVVEVRQQAGEGCP